MATGAEQAGAPPESGHPAAEPDWLGAPVADPAAVDLHVHEEPGEPRRTGPRLFGGLLILLALAWIGAVGWSAWRSPPEPSLAVLIGSAGTVTGPLILLALLWLMWGRTPRRETERFTRAIEAMRAESIALQSVLDIVAGRIEENHGKLRDKAERLMSLGDEASDRLGRVTHYLARESATLDRQSAALEAAAAAAKVDIGVLLHDLPRAEEQARTVAEAMKEAGLAAHGQAGALEAQLAALAARGREADELVGGAAQRMAAHVARIDSSAAAAAASMGEASAGMTAAVDGAMSRAAEAVDAARGALETQAAAMLAAIEQSRAALDKAGEDAARNLGQRLDLLAGKVETLAGHLAAQDAASQALVTGLAKELAELDDWFAQLGRTGGEHAERLAGSVDAVRESTRSLIGELGDGKVQTGELIERAKEMAKALDSIAARLGGELPGALERVESQAARTQAAAAALAPLVEGLEASSGTAAARIGEAEAAIGRQREALDALLSRIDEGAGGAEEKLQALGAAAAQASETASRIAAETGPELIEALVRVREAANQAAERAREAIASVIPASAAALGEAGRKALVEAAEASVGEQMDLLGALAQRSLDAAREASERLTRQMLILGETTAAIEDRIDRERREREAKDSDNFSRRVALLIESLNSTAIDVTKILSNEVTDSAWAAYLKGDRGVFTRRAVRLLETAEAREIARHYEEEPEFREQVNRYIHDFEAMLRRILADRDGSPLGVTLLSSDMGKLYVALAQAIERLRK
jgi:hypothetical protein